MKFAHQKPDASIPRFPALITSNSYKEKGKDLGPRMWGGKETKWIRGVRETSLQACVTGSLSVMNETIHVI